MTGSVYRRGKRWWFTFTYKGKKYSASSNSTRKSDAQQLLHMYLVEIAQGTFTGLKTGKDVIDGNELFDEYLEDCTERGLRGVFKIKNHMAAIRREFGKLPINHIDEERIRKYKEKRVQERSPTTVNRETQIIGQALRLAQKRNLIKDVPKIEKYREDNAREVFFERYEFDALLSHLPPDIRDFCLFGYLTGWRMNEISQLRWADVEEDAIRLKGAYSKNREGRFLMLVGELKDLIHRQPRRSEFVFTRDNGNQTKTFYKAWRTACKKAGIPGKMFHDFRRTATRNLRRAGVDQGTIMKITGHKTPIMFYRYNIIDEADQKAALEKIATQGLQ